MTTAVESVSSKALSALESELVGLLGPGNVTTAMDVRERASVDGATMSPVLVSQFPLGLADIVAFPQDAHQIAQVVSAAARCRVPVTPRGRGTGNYGQGIPLCGGLVVDLTKARAVVEVAEGQLTAEAGATMAQLERAAAASGQQLWMYPSTVQSTLGGFLSGGSGGTGTIVHGLNWQGFVAALDVSFPEEAPALVHLEGDQAQPFVHTYGTAGIIARATVKLEPLQDWYAFYASFNDFPPVLSLVRAFAADLAPSPRLVSGDRPPVVDALPSDPAIPRGRCSLRAILDAPTLRPATEMVERAGGRVEALRQGLQACARVSLLSYNHPVYWLQRSAPPNTYFHVEVGRDPLVERAPEVEAVYRGGMLHVEAGHEFPIGMLAAPFESTEAVLRGYARLEELGVRVHSPHQWFVDHNVEETRALKARVDPLGLLNPGKMPLPNGPATSAGTVWGWAGGERL